MTYYWDEIAEEDTIDYFDSILLYHYKKPV